jgi:electron transport complex protein RnfG
MSGDGSATRQIGSSALTLAAIAAICTALVSLTHELTRERIADNRRAFLEESLRPVLAGIDYEGELSDSTMTLQPPHGLPGNDAATVYRVYADSRPLAALFVVTAMDGYAGPIRLLIGLRADGTVNRVRVLDHRETPGLGDRIEASKSDWIEIFRGRSLEDPPGARWEIERDGGAFDQMTGASITSRSVVRAVRRTLVFFAENRDTVFDPDDPSKRSEP